MRSCGDEMMWSSNVDVCCNVWRSFSSNCLYMQYGSAVGDRQMIIDASIKMGFLTGDETEVCVYVGLSPDRLVCTPSLSYAGFVHVPSHHQEMMNAHASAATIVGEPFAQPAVFDFSTQRMTRRVNELVPAMLKVKK